MPQTPSTRRRWYQFSLGTVFVVVTGLAILCWGIAMRPYTLQHRVLVTLPAAQVMPAHGELRATYSNSDGTAVATYQVETWRVNSDLKWPLIAMGLLVAPLVARRTWSRQSKRRERTNPAPQS
jgi:hypothetical protein